MAGMTWRYFRLYITRTESPSTPGTATTDVAMESLVLSATSGGAQLMTGGTASASTLYSGAYPASYGFTSATDYWYSQAGLAPPHWLKYDLGAGNTATPRFLKMTPYSPASIGGYHPYFPVNFELQGSDNDSTWTTLAAFTDLRWVPGSRWYAGNGTTLVLNIPIGHRVAGNSTHSDGDPTRAVVAFDWATGAWIETMTPDDAGDFSSNFVGPDDVGLLHMGDSGYQPVTDGPITPSAI